MAKTISPGHTDTAVEGVTALDLDLPVLNFAEDFAVLSASASEIVLTNVTCPVDAPETVRVAQKAIKDVYAGTDLDPSVYAASRKGTATNIKLRKTYVETDGTDPSYQVSIPAEIGITLNLPVYNAMTKELVMAMAARAVAMLFEQGVVDASRLGNIQRGVLKPKALL